MKNNEYQLPLDIITEKIHKLDCSTICYLGLNPIDSSALGLRRVCQIHIPSAKIYIKIIEFHINNTHDPFSSHDDLLIISFFHNGTFYKGTKSMVNNIFSKLEDYYGKSINELSCGIYDYL